jgi:hypothetical protein
LKGKEIGAIVAAIMSVAEKRDILLVEQESAAVAAYRRDPNGGFTREVHVGLDAVIPLPEIGCELPLADLYKGGEAG